MMTRLDREKRLEIREYVGALEGRGRIVAAVAIVAGFLAVVVYILQPQRYSATATVVLPIPPSSTTSAIAAVSEAYADFNGAVTTDVVADRTAADVGVPASAVAGHLSVSRLAGGSVAQVTYNGTDNDHAVAIANAASKEALVVVIAARLAPLDQQLALAQSAYNAANDDFRTFIQETGIYNEQFFARQQLRIIHLQDELGNAQANSDEAAVADIQSQIATKNANISQYRADFDRLTSTRQSALEAYTTAQQAELSEKGLLESAQAGGQVSTSDPTGASRLTGLIKAVVPAVVVATGLAIAMIVLLEVVGPVRLPTRRARDREGDQGPDERDGAEASKSKEPEPKASEPEEPKEPEPDDLDEPEEPARDPAGRPIRTRA